MFITFEATRINGLCGFTHDYPRTRSSRVTGAESIVGQFGVDLTRCMWIANKAARFGGRPLRLAVTREDHDQ